MTRCDGALGRQMQFRLRPADQSDFDFIWRLRVVTMKASIEQSYGWDETTQREYAAESLAGQIVLVDEKPVGVLTLTDWGDQLHLTWLAILPAWQGQGLGGQLLRHCQQRAVAAGQSLSLQVLKNNPAVHLYERLGFTTDAHSGPHKLMMCWRAMPIQGRR